MPAVAFVTDVPETITLAAGKHTSWIQLAKTGTFTDPRYGKFTITLKMYDTWERNFAALSSPEVGRRGIPLDFDHMPEKRGETEAAGWIVKLERRTVDGKPTLWGLVEWTQIGLDAVKEGRYVYISPSYAENYVDEEGKQHGTHLVGAALTNRPFLTMATISLSRDPFAHEEPDSPRRMPELTKEFLTSLGLDAEKADTVLSADDPAAACKVALAEVANTEPDPAKPEPTPDPVVAGGKTLSELARESGMVIMSGAQVAQLAADAAKGAAAAETLRTNTFDTAWTQAVDQGKVLPVSKATFELAYDADPTATIKQLSDLPKGTIKVAPTGHTGDTDDTTTLSVETRSEIEGERTMSAPDASRDRMARRLDALLAEGKDYDEAEAIVEREFAGVGA